MKDNQLQRERNTEELIPLLKDSYGELSKNEIIQKIRNEDWKLLEGRGGTPSIQKPDGRMVPGSPAPVALGFNSYSNTVVELRALLMDRVVSESSFDEFFDALMTKIRGGDVRAMVLFRDSFLGRPPDVSPNATANDSLTKSLMMEMALATRYRDA